MRKIILFSLFLFLLLFSSQASAFEDSTERYISSYTEEWTISKQASNPGFDIGTVSASVVSDPRGISQNTVLKLNAYAQTSSSYEYTTTTCWVTTIENISVSYISFIVAGDSAGVTNEGLRIKVLKDNGDTLATFDTISYSTVVASKYEIIQSGSYFDLYCDGVLKQSKVSSVPGYSGLGKVGIGAAAYAKNTGHTYYVYIDDITTGSIIGSQKVFTEAVSSITYTWSAQLMRSYETQHEISIYSITNPSNAGKITSWNIPQDDNASTSEYGYLSFSRSGILGLNYGLYLLEMTRGSTVLADTYFYYDSLADPVGYPEALLMASSNVRMDIRDYSNEGGTVDAYTPVYIYRTNGTEGYYPVSFTLLNTPYTFEATLAGVYGLNEVDSTEVTFDSLTNYYTVELDGESVGTADSDEWSYEITDWTNYTSHVFSFSPDLTKPGVYGYVRNLATNAGIHGAIVTIMNDTTSMTVQTDENGYYYQAVGIEANETYTLSAQKSGYTASTTYTVTTQPDRTSRKDIYMESPASSGSGIYYASHDVTFTVLEYWYSSAGLPGVSYAVYDGNESVKTGTTGSKGTFTVKDMNQSTNYTISLTYNGTTSTEYIEPGLTEYTLVLNKEGIVHQYFNSWLTLTYAETSNNATVLYTSNKTVSAASFTVTASNGTIVQSNTLNTTSGTFTFDFTEGDYILQFNIEASDGSTASQAWSISSPPEVNLFPASYPTWLKNTLFGAIVIIFLLAFGKSKNDIACGSVAVLTSFAYYFEWLTCSFNFVVLIWIIALGAIFLHYKRTGAVG